MKIKNYKLKNKIVMIILILVCLFGLMANVNAEEAVNKNLKIYAINKNMNVLEYNKNNINYCLKSNKVLSEEHEYAIALLQVEEEEILEPKILSVEEILEKYGLTEYEFKVVVGVVLSEAKTNSYEDAYAVINTIYNRTRCKRWVRSANNRGLDGTSLYSQVILPNQFTVYQSGSYLRYFNDDQSVGYNAIIDFLSTEEIMHNYLNFASSRSIIANSEQFTDDGNNYYVLIKDEEIIII